MAYGKLIDGQIVYVSAKKVEKDGQIIFNPSEDVLNSVGIYRVEQVAENGANHIENGKIICYIGAENEEDAIKYKLSDTSSLVEALERLIAANGTTQADKDMAAQRIALRDELGKLMQTEEGDGTDMNPYKWTDGKAVISGKWYTTPSGYIWEAIADGVPSSETDTNYFDVVGL